MVTATEQSTAVNQILTTVVPVAHFITQRSPPLCSSALIQTHHSEDNKMLKFTVISKQKSAWIVCGIFITSLALKSKSLLGQSQVFNCMHYTHKAFWRLALVFSPELCSAACMTGESPSHSSLPDHQKCLGPFS